MAIRRSVVGVQEEKPYPKYPGRAQPMLDLREGDFAARLDATGRFHWTIFQADTPRELLPVGRTDGGAWRPSEYNPTTGEYDQADHMPNKTGYGVFLHDLVLENDEQNTEKLKSWELAPDGRRGFRIGEKYYRRMFLGDFEASESHRGEREGQTMKYPWTLDDLTLVLDFYRRHNENKDLSSELVALTFPHPKKSVEAQIRNFSALDPKSGSGGLPHVSRKARLVWEIFKDDSKRLRSESQNIAKNRQSWSP